MFGPDRLALGSHGLSEGHGRAARAAAAFEHPLAGLEVEATHGLAPERTRDLLAVALAFEPVRGQFFPELGLRCVGIGHVGTPLIRRVERVGVPDSVTSVTAIGWTCRGGVAPVVVRARGSAGVVEGALEKLGVVDRRCRCDAGQR